MIGSAGVYPRNSCLNIKVNTVAEITLELPENLIDYSSKLGSITQRNVDEVLAEALGMFWLIVEDSPDLLKPSAIDELTNTEVLELSKAKVSSAT
ncbi:MAG: hypothetical protein WA902_19850 [Thermosynechococcaceae cyanobacterium]